MCRKLGPYKTVAAAYKETGQRCGEYREYIKNEEKKVDYMKCYKEAVELSAAYLKDLHKVYLVLKEGESFSDGCKERFLGIVSDADLSCPLKRGF